MEEALANPTHRRSEEDELLLATCYAKTGQHQEAISILERLLERSRNNRDSRTEAACLGNLGHLHRIMGNAEIAREYLQQARTLHRQRSDTIGEAEDVRQLAALEGNSRDEVATTPADGSFDFWNALLVSPNVEEQLTAMLRNARAQADPLLECNALDGLGVVARNRGALEEAIGFHEQALTVAAGMEGVHGVVPKVVGNNNLGITYRMLGDFDRARDCYQSAIAAAHATLGSNNPLELMPRANLAKLRLLEGNPEAAKKEYLDKPRTIVSDTDRLIDLDVQIGIFQQLQDTTALLPALTEMAAKCSAAGLVDREADTYKILGHTHYTLGQMSIAIDFYDRALTMLGEHGSSRQARADVLYFRSLARLGNNDYIGAFADATQSVKDSSVLTSQLAIESVKRHARIQTVERYAHLAVICGHLNRIPDALEYLERSRSGLLNALLATRHIAPNQDVPAALVDQLGDLQRQRRRLDLLIIQEQEMPLYKGRLGELVTQSLAAKSAWEDLLGKVAAYDPVFEQFRDVPIRYEQIEGLIPRDKRTALLEFCVADTRIQVVLVVPGLLQQAYTISGLSRHRLLELLKSKWFGPLRRLRQQARDTDTRASDLDAMLELLGELHRELFEPKGTDGETLRECLARHRVERLVVVPHGLLHLLPLHALWHNTSHGRHYLIDDFEIVYAPSCSVLRYCARNAAASDSLLAFADPDGSLRGARNEVTAIKRHFTAATVYEGRDATVEAALRLSATTDVLHIACHGSFDEHSPLSSGLAMADGKLTLNRIFEDCRVKPGALVTLSACETGMVAPDRTDEYVGLPSGFLFAGANCVIGSLWPVNDACTSTAMQATYEHIQRHHNSPAASLRAAQRTLKEDAAYAHPYFWAPFQVVGAGWTPRR